MTHQGRWLFPVMVRARNSFGGMASPVVFSCYLDLGLTRVAELKY